MTRTNRAVVAAMAVISMAALTPSLAQAQVSEPATFQAQHPDRDVLNGGQFTPAARAGAGPQGAGSAYAAYPSPRTPAVRARHGHSRQ